MLIIHVTRNLQEVSDHLKFHDEIMRLSETRRDLYRLCSNYDVNLGLQFVESNPETSNVQVALKRAERDFLRFIDTIRRESTPPELPSYSHSLMVPVADLRNHVSPLQTKRIGSTRLSFPTSGLY